MKIKLHHLLLCLFMLAMSCKKESGIITPTPPPVVPPKTDVTPFIFSRGRGSVIRWKARTDLFPFHKFSLGRNSTIEDFCTINNGVGNVMIGDESRIRIGSVLIGPVTIGNQVIRKI